MMKRREPGPLFFSIAIHVVIAAAILNAAFHYNFSTPEATHPAPSAERVNYLAVAPAGGITTQRDTSSKAAKAVLPLPAPALVAPTSVPTSIAPPAPATGGTTGGVVGGKSTGGGVGATTGIVPGEPDPRLVADPRAFLPDPKTHSERVDSAVRALIYAYNDSVARAQGRKPGDWTVEKGGQKWGIDGNKIYLGKFAIPSAVLAALPIRIQGNPGESINDRLSTTRSADLRLHADAMYHDDDFGAAVKRIRERKEKERAEKQQGGDVDKPIASTPEQH